MFGDAGRRQLDLSATLAGNNETPLWDRLFVSAGGHAPARSPPRCSSCPPALQLDAYDATRLPDIFSGAIVALIAIALGMVALVLSAHRLFHSMKNPC